MAFALILIGFFARVFALGAQDRVIRLEERLRMHGLLPDDLKPRINDFTMDQLAALRFASDGWPCPLEVDGFPPMELRCFSVTRYRGESLVGGTRARETMDSGARSSSTKTAAASSWRCWAVRSTLVRTCWVAAPRAERLPPQTLRLTTAGRRACSARQLVASTVGSKRKLKSRHLPLVDILIDTQAEFQPAAENTPSPVPGGKVDQIRSEAPLVLSMQDVDVLMDNVAPPN